MMSVRFPLSLRQVEDVLHERGIDVNYETVRPCVRGGDQKEAFRTDANQDAMCWHLDEVFVRINGETHYLWRAVDHEGEVLESFVTKRRDRKAALTFLRKAMKQYGPPRLIVTDRLRSYGAAMREIGNASRQETGHWLNNRVAQQPGRKLTSTLPATEARDGKIQER